MSGAGKYLKELYSDQNIQKKHTNSAARETTALNSVSHEEEKYIVSMHFFGAGWITWHTLIFAHCSFVLCSIWTQIVSVRKLSVHRELDCEICCLALLFCIVFRKVSRSSWVGKCGHAVCSLLASISKDLEMIQCSSACCHLVQLL